MHTQSVYLYFLRRFVLHDIVTSCEPYGLLNADSLLHRDFSFSWVAIFSLGRAQLLQDCFFSKISYSLLRRERRSVPQGHEYVLRAVAKVVWMVGKDGRMQICRRAQCNYTQAHSHHALMFLFALALHPHHGSLANLRANSMLQCIWCLALHLIQACGVYFPEGINPHIDIGHMFEQWHYIQSVPSAECI